MNSASKDVLITGIDAVNDDASITIYPNPSSGRITIEFSGAAITGDVSIDIMNTLGQKVFSSEENIIAVNWRKNIELNDVARGICFIEIKSENGLLRKKIIIIK